MKDIERHLYRIYEKFISMDQDFRLEKAKESNSYGLTDCQCRYLQLIDANEPLTLGQFAKLTCVSKPTVSQLVSRFINEGLIIKESCPHDRRSCYLRMTDKGRQAARSDQNARIEIIRYFESNLTEEETISFIELMDKLLNFKEEK